MIVNLSAFGTSNFQSYSPPVTNMNKITIQNAIYDEIHIRENTSGIDASNVKEDWQMDTVLLAKFLGDLEAGNINNQGINITQFAIKRRKVNEITPITLGYKDFVNNNQFVFDDYTQPNDEFVYSIVPVGENGLEGQENSITIKSDFTGYHLVDKDTNEVLSFDKFIGSEPNISTTLNQGRTQIDTLTKYPRFFYNGQNYHTFSLQATFIPEDWQNSEQLYQSILNQYVYSHKPFLVKSGSGSVYVVDVYNPSIERPLNVYRDRDYFTLTLQCTEIMSYDDYMKL
jgi:hypothetical protein